MLPGQHGGVAVVPSPAWYARPTSTSRPGAARPAARTMGSPSGPVAHEDGRRAPSCRREPAQRGRHRSCLEEPSFHGVAD